MEDLNIYVVTHKKFELSDELKNSGFKLISVGSAHDFQNEGVKDNALINIADKNSNYCELTALYWIWKNDHISKYKGLCHYRRYFTNSFFSHKEEYFLKNEDFNRLFEKGIDIILPEMQYFTRTASENYLRCGYQKDLDTTEKVIAEKYPDYLKDYYMVMNGNKSYLTNMMVAKSSVFDSYCEWLFDILFEVEKRTDLTGYSKQEARIYGYISERLLTVWVYHNNYKFVEVHTTNIEEKQTFVRLYDDVLIKLGLYQQGKTILWNLKKLVKSGD